MKKLSLKEILLPALALCLICFITAGAMAVVRHFTRAPIEKNQLAEASDAREAIFPGAALEEHENYCAAYRDGTLAGYLMETQAQGYGGPIQLAVGIDPDGRVLHVQVLAADSETPGLGQKIKEAGFLSQFADKQSLDGIDCIAGATISSKAVADAVDHALEIYKSMGGDAG